MLGYLKKLVSKVFVYLLHKFKLLKYVLINSILTH